MINKYAGLLAAVFLLAIAAYFALPGTPESELVLQAADEHAAEAPLETAAFVVAAQQPPVDGFLCAGVLSLNVPGDEQEFSELFSVALNAVESEAIVAGLWPSPQFLAELQPPFWQTEMDSTDNALLITGIGMTDAASLTSRISLNPETLQYAISWSVFPVGFRTPVEFWTSAGTCEAFGQTVAR